jgi:3,4-dihydroxy 2-butanone 4-phosphate synthase/GTP cyclohydrolase II
MVQRAAEREADTPWGKFRLVSYKDRSLGSVHLALVLGDIRAQHETLVRVHEPLSVLDLLDAGADTHSWGIGKALTAIRDAGTGVMVLMNCSQSSESLLAQLAGGRPARQGRSMELRTYGIGAQILRDLGVGKMRLLAAPRKMPSMAGFGLEVTGYVTGWVPGTTERA